MANDWVSFHVRWFVELVHGSPYSCIMPCITSGQPSSQVFFFSVLLHTTYDTSAFSTRLRLCQYLRRHVLLLWSIALGLGRRIDSDWVCIIDEIDETR